MRTPVRPHLLLALLVALVTFGSAEPASATEKLSYNYGSALYFQSDDLKGVSVMTSGQVRETVRLTLDYRCLLYTSPSPRDQRGSRMPSSA